MRAGATSTGGTAAQPRLPKCPSRLTARLATFREAGAPDDSAAAITFTTEPLAADQVLLGPASLTFRATLDAAEAHFYVELIEVEPNDEEHLVNDGFLAASHRRSHTDPEPVPSARRSSTASRCAPTITGSVPGVASACASVGGAVGVDAAARYR